MSMTLWAPLGSILGRPAEKGAPRLRRARRLYRERIWHPMLSRLLQVGILAAIIALWQIGVETGFIDGFFWSYRRRSSRPHRSLSRRVMHSSTPGSPSRRR